MQAIGNIKEPSYLEPQGLRWTILREINIPMVIGIVLFLIGYALFKIFQTPADILTQLDSKQSLYDPNKIFKKIDGSHQTAEELLKEMFSKCNKINFLWKEFLQQRNLYQLPAKDMIGLALSGNAEELQKHLKGSGAPKKFKNLLDLGAGSGANSIIIAEQGIPVIAVDCNGDLLKQYETSCVNTEELSCVNLDLSTMQSFSSGFEVVLAIDVLPYLPPKSLKATMQKIYRALEENGHFFGTIFMKGNSKIKIVELHEQLGAHFYCGGATSVQKFLEHFDFKVITIDGREEGGYSFHVQKVATSA